MSTATAQAPAKAKRTVPHYSTSLKYLGRTELRGGAIAWDYCVPSERQSGVEHLITVTRHAPDTQHPEGRLTVRCGPTCKAIGDHWHTGAAIMAHMVRMKCFQAARLSDAELELAAEETIAQLAGERPNDRELVARLTAIGAELKRRGERGQ